MPLPEATMRPDVFGSTVGGVTHDPGQTPCEMSRYPIHPHVTGPLFGPGNVPLRTGSCLPEEVRPVPGTVPKGSG